MISVCVATYNGEKHIKEQLESILSQIGKNDEVIISDDGSSDNTINIIKSFSDVRIKIFINSLQNGVVGNFNNALLHASGEVIFLSYQDDVWLENKVKLSLEKILNYDLIVTNCMVTDANLNIVDRSYFDLVNSGTGFIKNIYKSTYLGCCLVFNRKVLDAILPIPNNLMMYHDWWIGFIAEQKFKVHFESKPLLLYRRHGNTTSSTVGKSKNSLFFKIKSRWQLLTLGLKRLKELEK